MRLRTALMACTALLMPCMASADPVTAFFGGLGLTSATTAAVGAALFPTAYAVGTFFTTTLGALILNIGLGAVLRPSAPGIDALRVNSRREDAPRWQLAGLVCAGGETGIFGEHDSDGNFWYICAHGDAELVGDPGYLLDGIEVTVSDGTDGFAAGDVLTDVFCLRENRKRYEGSGTRVPYVRLYTVSPSASEAYGALPADFTAAFPDLPADFFLVGVCYTIVRCKAINRKYYSNIWHWSGNFRLGEPAVSLIGDFNRMYDPRDVAQDLDDPATWASGGSNAALIWAWWRTTGRGRNRPTSEINWDLVAVAADACDQIVLDRTATEIPRYRCGVAFPDTRPRHECEAEILKTFCAFVAYDDEGRAYPVAGVYEAPTLTFHGTRDILDVESQIIEDGETALDGVVVEYMSPDHGWTKQRSAPWINPAFYDGAAEPNYQVISALGCQNHNQAVRIAKDHGQRVGATKKAALTTGLRGMLATTKRNVLLSIDSDFDGDFEIATPVEESGDGQSFAFAVVPMQEDRFDLGPGEEGLPPQTTPILDPDDDLETAVDVVVSAVSVRTSSGEAVRLEATFDAPLRADREFAFRFTLDGSGIYEDMTVDMDELRAWSSIVEAGSVYEVQWQTTTAGGRASDWSTAVEVTAAVTPLSFELLVEPAPDGISRSVAGLPDGTQLVIGDGEWWRRVSTGKIASAADYIALFDTAEYQIEQVDKTRAQVLTLTRASTGTYVDSDGVMQTAGVDVVRVDHSANGGALLVEPTATNRTPYSRYSASNWTLSGVSVGAATRAALDGATITAFDASGSAVNHRVVRALTDSISAGAVFTLSFDVAFPAGHDVGYIFVRMRHTTGGQYVRLQVASGVPTFSSSVPFGTNAPPAVTSGDVSVRAVAVGLYRVTITGQVSPIASAFTQWDIGWSVSTTEEAAGTANTRLFIDRVQIEDGALETSYIPTTTASVTRAADVIAMNGITATLDLALTYGDGTTGTASAAAVTPGYWPTLAQTRLRRLVGRA